MNIGGAFKSFWAVLKGAKLVPAEGLVKQSKLDAVQKELSTSQDERTKIAERVKSLEADLKAAKEQPDRFEEGAVYALLLLQREGRLIDFLQEDLGAFADDQIGAAVRQIHKDSAKVLRENFAISPVIDQHEGEAATVPEPHQPSVVRLTGSVPDAPPYKGTLRHKGWKAAKVSLPKRTGDIDISIVQPAEIEI